MNWFNLSLVGWIVLIVALVIAALQFEQIPRIWIGIGALALFGLAIITSAKHSKPRV